MYGHTRTRTAQRRRIGEKLEQRVGAQAVVEVDGEEDREASRVRVRDQIRLHRDAGLAAALA